jgi:hypothetical protein
MSIGPCDRGFQLRRYFLISSSEGTHSNAPLLSGTPVAAIRKRVRRRGNHATASLPA